MADTEVGTGAGESLEFVNAMWRGDHVIAWNRLEDGRIAEKRYRAEYSYFLRTRDLDRAVEVEVAGLKRETTVRKEVRRSRATRDIRIEGEFARVICTDSDSRYRACRGTRDRPSWFEYHGIETFEADLHPVKRWLIDQEPRIQKPRRAYFDIETDSRVPFSRKLEMRILCWAMVTRSGERVLGMLESDTDRAERILLEDFWGEAEEHDQLLAWNGDRFDFELIKHRTKMHRIRVDPRRWLWLDHMEAFRKYNMHSTESGEEKDSVALDRVAEGLRLDQSSDVEAIGDKRAIDPRFTWQLWEGGGEGREQLGRRCLADASLMAAVERKTGYLELHDTVCQTCGLFPDSRALSARDHVEAFVMRLANKRALRFPSKWGKPDGPPRQKFRGAVVFDVKPGIRRDVHVCDFAGMYPGIIETFNLSPEMIAPELAGREGETWGQVAARLPSGYCVAPGTREVFRTELEGVLAETVRTLKQSRKSLKKIMKANPENSPVWLAANRLSQGAKITVNSGFGVASSEFSRLCDVRVGESITLTGALLIHRTVELSRQVFPDSEIVFGDSVTGDRVVVLRAPDRLVRLLPIEQAWGLFDGADRGDGKQVCNPIGWQALARDRAGVEGWFPLEAIVRHRSGKPTWRVTTKDGQTHVTEDHGIMVGDRATRPADFVSQGCRFETLSAPTEESLEVIDLFDFVSAYRENRSDGTGVRFEADDESVWVVGSRISKVRIRRFYHRGSSELRDLLWLVAAYVGDGSASTKETTCRYMLSFCKSDLGAMNETKRCLENVAPGIRIFGPYWTDTVYVVRSGTVLMASLFAALCGQKSRGKRLPTFAYHLEDSDRQWFIDALAQFDGRLDERGHFEYETNSQQLFAGVSYVASQHGLQHGIGYRDSKAAWRMRGREFRNSSYFVKSVRFDPDPEQYVYDLTVAGAHTFVDACGRVLLHNTDSIAICGPTADQFRAFVERCNRELYPAIIEQARGRTNQLELEYEKELELLIQTGVKKRYAGRYKGVSVDTDPVIKGLEFKRGDTARFTRYFQQEVIARLLMIGQEVPTIYPVQPDEFVETIERWKARVLTGDLVRRDVVISKSINKELRDYVRKQKKDGTLAADPIHVAIARMLEERGEDVSEGTRIEYVVADGDASPIRAIPAAEWEPGKEDRFYLWERVVWRPTRRVLEACWPGYDWSRWDHAKDRGGGRGRSRYLPGQAHLPWFGQ